MGILDYFKPVRTWSATAVREFLQEKNPEQYNLVDVRQPKEYERQHLPGAKLLPVGELRDRLGELDPAKTTIAYCAVGGRSRAAAAILSNARFRQVVSMEGGIKAWHGIVAKGFPEKAMAFFAGAGSPAQFVALAWLLEEGTRKFYEDMIKTSEHPAAAELFQKLAAAEDHHQATLSRLYETDIAKSRPDRSLQEVAAAERPEEALMEGAVPLGEALAWARGKPTREILEYCIGIEVDAYDRYLIMQENVINAQAQKVFKVLSDEERLHLAKLTALFEQMV